MTAESLYPHILNIWQLSPSTLTFSTYNSWVPLPSHSRHITAESLYPHILDVWQLSHSTLTFSTYDSWVPLPSHYQHITAESRLPSHDQHTTAQIPKPYSISMWQLSPSNPTQSLLMFKSVLEGMLKQSSNAVVIKHILFSDHFE